MPYVLTVTEPMTGYAIGQRITDQAEIDRIMAPGHSHTVKQVWVSDDEIPKPEPADEPAPAEEPVAEPKGKAKADTSAK